jgi:hypothetical protein
LTDAAARAELEGSRAVSARPTGGTVSSIRNFGGNFISVSFVE